ncbi:MAG: hypothetical protein HN742_04315 [Lentisphaerae bacterium]|nr:hypothetical protein [Lentisphaerota bacterium]MBT4822050.1 hypothetical protein [Lentisphaerota bacterium]MBT5609152.1 hypothetical protein [Lentisphaerota bacterium]MBT7054168.1 hypothetical protein [Lentisphaerota bacterium]MBT7841068.1 hypothetical protein [Lentisphaerota bacterium]
MAKKRIMIRCDIEGVSGVVSYEQAEPGKAEYAFGQRMFMADLMAAIEGLTTGGADEIVIYDEHYYGRNVDVEALPAHVSVICGKPPYRADWAGGLDVSFAGVVLVGFHSKFGTPEGLLHHSYELDIRDLRLNGVSVGEIGMEAAVAGDSWVPVLMVTGDSAGVAEAQTLLPGVRGVVVKESLGETGGGCLPLTVSTDRIRQAAESVVRTPPDVQPYRPTSPVRLEIKLNDGPYLEAIRRLCPNQMTDDRTLVLEKESVTATWATYWQIKLAAQAAAEA